jgi:hypothetical protein
VQTQVRQLPPGITPPLVIKYSASSIPVVQLALSSPTLPEQSVFDAAVNQLRPAADHRSRRRDPFPYGGKNRQISVDLDMQALQARGLSPADVVNAVNLQNLILPRARQVRRHRVLGEDEQFAGCDRRPERPAGAHGQRHDDLPARRGATSATASPRKPTSSGRTACAACCCR